MFTVQSLINKLSATNHNMLYVTVLLQASLWEVICVTATQTTLHALSLCIIVSLRAGLALCKEV